MKKLNCYSKYTVYLPLAICFFLLSMAFLPFLIFKNDSVAWKIVWSISMALFSAIMFYSFLFHRQVIIFYQDRMVLKNVFGVLQELNPQKCFIEITILPTEFSWAIGTIMKKWICIYEKNDDVIKFVSGVANGKKHKRIQCIFSKTNYALLQQYVKQIEGEPQIE